MKYATASVLLWVLALPGLQCSPTQTRHGAGKNIETGEFITAQQAQLNTADQSGNTPSSGPIEFSVQYIPNIQQPVTIAKINHLPGSEGTYYAIDDRPLALSDKEIWLHAAAYYAAVKDDLRQKGKSMKVLVGLINRPGYGTAMGIKPQSSRKDDHSTLQQTLVLSEQVGAASTVETVAERKQNKDKKTAMKPRVKPTQMELSHIHAEQYAKTIMMQLIKERSGGRAVDESTVEHNMNGVVFGQGHTAVDRPDSMNNCGHPPAGNALLDPTCAAVPDGVKWYSKETCPVELRQPGNDS